MQKHNGRTDRHTHTRDNTMTDLIKTYKTAAVAKGIAKKTARDDAQIIVKGGLAAIVEKPKVRSHRIDTPKPLTARAWTWAECNRLLDLGMEYKELRATAIYNGICAGFHRPQLQTEVSRWRHRFN